MTLEDKLNKLEDRIDRLETYVKELLRDKRASKQEEGKLKVLKIFK